MNLSDAVLAAAVGVVRAGETAEELLTPETGELLRHALLLTDPSAKPDSDTLRGLLEELRREKARLAPDCAVCSSPCGRTADADIDALAAAPEETRPVRRAILSLARELARNGDTAKNTLPLALFFWGGDAWTRQELEDVAVTLQNSLK